MGRTFRSRKSRKQHCDRCQFSAECCSEIIDLNKCLKKALMKREKSYKLFNFNETGRGVKAMEKIIPGATLMEVPFNLILNIHTLQLDTSFKNMFCMAYKEIDESVRFTCQQLLAFYICYIKMMCSNEFWMTYIKTIPSDFSVPYFFDSKLFTSEINTIVNKQREEILSGYENLLNILNVNNSLKKSFSLDTYAWAYFAVNSRCVYLKPDIVINEVKISVNNQLDSFSFLDIIIDTPNLGLIPYLDMFNHSPFAKTDVFFDYLSKEERPVYKLITLTECKKYSQIFIQYGEHSNLKLFTEYGFCLSSNPFSNLPLDGNEILNFDNINVDKDRYQYIKKHRLNENLFIDVNGMSYNLIRMLFILSNSNKTAWDMKVYSATTFDEKEIIGMNKMIAPLIMKKISHYESYLDSNKLNQYVQIAYNILLNDYIQFLCNALS